MTPSVSVIIPVYNTERFIERCVRSLMEQTLKNIEYIFVNDCTPDNSMLVLSRLLDEYPQRKSQVRIITHERNMGSGDTRKSGLLASLGEYVIQCDSDDWIDPQMYETMYCKAVEEKADIVCCNIWRERIGKRELWKYDYEYETEQMLSDLKLEGIYSSMCNKLIKLELYTIHNILPFDKINMWEDLGVTLRLRYFSRKTIVINQAFYHYNKQNENSIVSTPKLSSVEEQMRCAECIEHFFSEQNVTDVYRLPINYLKFLSKSSLLLVPAIRDVERWKCTYSETHADIKYYTPLPLNLRIVYRVATKGHITIVMSLLFIKSLIVKILRK